MATQPKATRARKTKAAETVQSEGVVDQQAASASKPKSRAKATAQTLVGQAGDKARDYANARKDAATERVESFASMIAGLAESLGDKLGPQGGEYAKRAADSVAKFADGLKAKDIDDLVDDTRRVIKQNPAAAIGAAAALGFVLVRLAKASPRDA